MDTKTKIPISSYTTSATANKNTTTTTTAATTTTNTTSNTNNLVNDPFNPHHHHHNRDISDDSCSNCGYVDSLDGSSGGSSHSLTAINNNCNSSSSCSNRGVRGEGGRGENDSRNLKHAPFILNPERDFGPNLADHTKRRSSENNSTRDLNGNSQSPTSPTSNNASSSKIRAPNMASLSKNPTTSGKGFSMSVDAYATSGCHGNERIHTARECAKDAAVLYLTPLQRKERASKEMKKEISKLYQELSQKDELIFQLRLQMEEQTKHFQEELDRKIDELKGMMEEKDRLHTQRQNEKEKMEEELATMDKMFTELKVKQKLQEDQFQERYLAMYKRGQKAALFEREQELEMIATTKQPKVTVKELTRKLSKTENELAKWQSLQRDEAYKSVEKPVTDADVTLAFMKDSFYHFVCDNQDCLRHFRAIVEIFKYSDSQMSSIRKAVSDSKEFSKMFKNDL